MQPELTTSSMNQNTDEAVKAFVLAWAQGPRPQIERILENWVGPGRNALLLKLLNVEISFAGQHRRAADRVGIPVAVPEPGRPRLGRV